MYFFFNTAVVINTHDMNSLHFTFKISTIHIKNKTEVIFLASKNDTPLRCFAATRPNEPLRGLKNAESREWDLGSHYNARVRSFVYIVNMVNILTTRTHVTHGPDTGLVARVCFDRNRTWILATRVFLYY